MAGEDAPAPFSAYTTPEFWDDDHISQGMLRFHLDPDAAPASRPHAVIDAAVAWLVHALGLHPGDSLLDLGCGPGLYAQRFAARGIEVTGLDVSRRSLAYATETARALGLPARFRRADYLVDDLGGPYDAAILVYEDYCALSPAQRETLLTRTRAAVRPGGSFAMDVTAAPRFAECTPVREPVDDPFWADPPFDGVHETFTYPALRLVLNRYTIVKGGESRAFWNWMHCLTPAEVATELAAAGFEHPRLYGDLAGSPYEPDADVFAVVTTVPTRRT